MKGSDKYWPKAKLQHRMACFDSETRQVAHASLGGPQHQIHDSARSVQPRHAKFPI
jgi:hypothetical protein